MGRPASAPPRAPARAHLLPVNLRAVPHGGQHALQQIVAHARQRAKGGAAAVDQLLPHHGLAQVVVAEGHPAPVPVVLLEPHDVRLARHHHCQGCRVGRAAALRRHVPPQRREGVALEDHVAGVADEHARGRARARRAQVGKEHRAALCARRLCAPARRQVVQHEGVHGVAADGRQQRGVRGRQARVERGPGVHAQPQAQRAPRARWRGAAPGGLRGAAVGGQGWRQRCAAARRRHERR